MRRCPVCRYNHSVFMYVRKRCRCRKCGRVFEYMAPESLNWQMIGRPRGLCDKCRCSSTISIATS